MRSSHVPGSIALAALLLVAACSRDQPTAPRVHSLSGHVKLTGFLVSPSGFFVGTRVLGDADGVAVELQRGTEVVARTVTVAGVYRFAGLAPGAYVART